jgi:cysteine-rich repeat protein
LYNNYNSPLPVELNGGTFLRLCGNGVLNKASDYNDPGDSIQVDEECDDGNRLDGDGCSADCMDVDTLVSPCKVNVVPLNCVAIDPVTDAVYVGTKAGTILEMTVGPTQVTTTLVSTQAAESMAAYNGSLFVYGNKQLHWHGEHMDANNGFWLQLGNEPIFITFTPTQVKVVNCAKKTTLALDATVNITHCYTSSNSPIACRGPDGEYSIRTTQNEDGTYSLQTGTISFSAYSQPPTSEDDPTIAWAKTFLEYASRSMVQIFVPTKTILGDSRVKRSREIVVSPTLFAVTKSNIRALRSPSTVSAFQTQDVQAIGNQLLVRAIKTADIFCYEDEPCYLDVSTPVFSMRSQVVQHPRTSAFFIVEDGNLYYIGRRGTQITTGDGHCVPYDVKACPAGQWGDANSTCRPCPASVNATAPIAQQIQCIGTGARRRLLSYSTITVHAHINVSDQVLREAFPGATVQKGLIYIETTDPRFQLQRMHTAIMNNSWQVIRNPEVLYRNAVALPPKEEGSNLITIVVPAVLGFLLVAGLVVLFGWFWWPCHDYREISK